MFKLWFKDNKTGKRIKEIAKTEEDAISLILSYELIGIQLEYSCEYPSND